MSDFLIVRGIDASASRAVLDAWARERAWVRSVATRDAWEPQALEINRRNAITYMNGKHKLELAELVRRLGGAGGQVIHVMIHRRELERSEQDIAGWADRLTSRSRDPGPP